MNMSVWQKQISNWIIIYVNGTLVSEELGGLQHFLCVDSRFIIVHFRSDHMDDSCSSAANRPGSAIQPINIFLLQSDDTLVHILQDVVLWGQTNNDAMSGVYVFLVQHIAPNMPSALTLNVIFIC